MSASFFESLNKLNDDSKNCPLKKIKLVNGEILNCTIISVNPGIIEVKMPSNGAGQPQYTIPFSSILYISDCNLE